jgi:hypothetical protein
MNLVRCENGHFYDSERFDECPHCNQTSVSTVLQDDDGNKEYTMPLNPVSSDPASTPSQRLEDVVGSAKGDDDAQKTIGYFGTIPSEPVVGWLVAIAGSHFGEDFRLKTGRNFIGRTSNMDVVLSGDSSVSRDKHAILLYEPKSNLFLVQPGDSKELFYLNNDVVLSATQIQAYDVLSIGASKLLFIPCCSDKFNWDAVKLKEEK